MTYHVGICGEDRNGNTVFDGPSWTESEAQILDRMVKAGRSRDDAEKLLAVEGDNWNLTIAGVLVTRRAEVGTSAYLNRM